jgi:OmpA-OmpF porin, OOP family
MRMKIALLAGSVLVLPAVAGAEPVSGLYVGAGIGANFPQNQTVKGFTAGGVTVGKGDNPKFDTGWLGVASVGWGLGNGLRLELEGDYRNNRFRSVSGLGKAGGRQEQYGAMFNVLYDVDLAPMGLDFMSPHIGFGGGYMQNSWNKFSAGGPGGTVTVNKAANGVAVQGILGAAFPLDMVAPGLDLTVEYRIMDMPSDRKYTANITAPGGTVGGKLKVADDFNHSVLVGMRYAFNQPEPPPPAPAPAPVAAPAPAPSRTYLVFFDWDRADLTERARQIISQAAQNSTRVQYTRIEVGGHADRTGSEKYNMALSLRRAQNVSAELVKDGVPESAIDVKAYGDTKPLVPTAAGVREPQNRRVEIILH